MGQRKNYSDKGVGRNFNRRAYEAATRQYPFFIGSIISFVQLITKAAAFSIRVFLRKNIGERTFGIWSIILSYFWVQYFLLDTAILEHLKEDFRFFGVVDFTIRNPLDKDTIIGEFSLVSWDELLRPVYIFISYFYQIFMNLLKMTNFIGGEDAYNESFIIKFYSWVVMTLGIIQIFKGVHRTNSWVKADSYRRGESIFFQWLIGIRLGKITVNQTLLYIIAEPLVIFFLGFMITSFWDYPHNAFGSLLMLSAIALSAEEYVEYLFKQERILDMMDSEFEGKRLEFALERIEEKEKIDKKADEGDFSKGVCIYKSPYT